MGDGGAGGSPCGQTADSRQKQGRLLAGHVDARVLCTGPDCLLTWTLLHVEDGTEAAHHEPVSRRCPHQLHVIPPHGELPRARGWSPRPHEQNAREETVKRSSRPIGRTSESSLMAKFGAMGRGNASYMRNVPGASAAKKKQCGPRHVPRLGTVFAGPRAGPTGPHCRGHWDETG